MVLEKLNIHMENNEIEPLLYSTLKNQLKMAEIPEYLQETNYKTLRRKHRRNLHDFGFSNDFLDLILQVTKGKIDKLVFIKMKNFRANDAINTVKRQPQGMGERFCKFCI